MAKFTISEENLQKLIMESIEESLQDEGLGTKIAQGLGRARQWVSDKVNNYTNAFNAGRNQQRFANKDYDPYQGMNNADQIRNFGGDEYGQYRYNVTADRNNRSAQSWKNKYGTTTNKIPSANGERMPNYFNGRAAGQGRNSTQVNGPEPQEKFANTSAQTQSTQTQGTEQQPAQKKGGFQAKQTRPIADIQAQVSNGRIMSKADGQLVSAALGEYKKNHPEIKENNNNNNNNNMKTVINEETLRAIVSESIKKVLNEIGDTPKGQYAMGKLAQRKYRTSKNKFAPSTPHAYAVRKANGEKFREDEFNDVADPARDERKKAFDEKGRNAASKMKKAFDRGTKAYDKELDKKIKNANKDHDSWYE